jgi:hypothetical protein
VQEAAAQGGRGQALYHGGESRSQGENPPKKRVCVALANLRLRQAFQHIKEAMEQMEDNGDEDEAEAEGDYDEDDSMT